MILKTRTEHNMKSLICIICLALLRIHGVSMLWQGTGGEVKGVSSSVCNQTLTQAAGFVTVTDLELTPGTLCYWDIAVPEIDSINVMFLPLMVTTSSSNNTSDPSPSVSVDLYSGIISESRNEKPNFRWSSNQNRSFHTFNSGRMHLVIQTPVNFTDSQNINNRVPSKNYLSVSYTAQVVDVETPGCYKETLPRIQHGELQFDNKSAFGSVARMSCDAGYTVSDSVNAESACTVVSNVGERIGGQTSGNNVSLNWTVPDAICESICLHPPAVQHGLSRLLHTTNFTQVESRAIDRSHGINSTTAQYICEPPYIMFPSNHSGLLTCDVKAVAETETESIHNDSAFVNWHPQPPSCIIPACSSRTILQERAGAVVNPSYPSLYIPGGQLCRWEIIAPNTAYIEVTPVYVDFPNDTETHVTIFDVGSARPFQMLQLPSRSREAISPVISASSKVIITFRGPEGDISGHRGFYLTYTMKTLDRFERQAQGSETGVEEPEGGPTVTTPTTAPTTVPTATPTAVPTAPPGDVPATSAAPIPTDNRQGGGADIDVDIPASTVPPEYAAVTVNGSDIGGGRQNRDVNGGAGGRRNSALDNVIIAVCVVVPIVALLLILIVSYICYRRKYPVRMIIGREVAKFENPKYSRSTSKQATLVRPDADNFFENGESGGREDDNDDDDTDGLVTLEMNPTDTRDLHQYDNPGYLKDEANDEMDEDEEERKFRAQKSWLFRRSMDKSGHADEERNSDTVDTGDGKRKGSGMKDIVNIEEEVDVTTQQIGAESKKFEEKQQKASRQRSEDSEGSDISALLGEQAPTPQVPRRRRVEESSSATESPVSARSLEQPANKEDHEVTVEKSSDESDESERKNKESNFMITAKAIFEQPSFEEVMAEVKARSRSVSLGNVFLDKSPRPRTYSVDPTKSARKNSVADDTILPSLVARKILETPTSSTASPTPHHLHRELSSIASNESTDVSSNTSPVHPPRLSASIVGVDIQVKTASRTSINSGGSSVSANSNTPEVFDSAENLAERINRISIDSSNSNAHLVTDLDDPDEEDEQTKEFLVDSPQRHREDSEGQENLPEDVRNTKDESNYSNEEVDNQLHSEMILPSGVTGENNQNEPSDEMGSFAASVLSALGCDKLEQAKSDSESDSDSEESIGAEASYDFGNPAQSDEEDNTSRSSTEEKGEDHAVEEADSAEEERSHIPEVLEEPERAEPSDSDIMVSKMTISLARDDAKEEPSADTPIVSMALLPDTPQSMGASSDPLDISNLTFTPTAAQPRMKITPLAVNLSDDDDDDSDEGDKYNPSDDDISDILKSSTDDDDSDDSDSQVNSKAKFNLASATPTTYTFQENLSDDEDIDV